MGPPPPPSPPAPSRSAELGAYLRLHRDATSPEDVGLDPGGAHRRTPGLRREEVSQLAGVGLSWYTWLEQGRDITPSAGVLDALARVLDLDGAERAHLFHLAEVPVPTADGPYPTVAPDDLAAVVAGLDPNPAYLIGPRADVLAWNRGATAIMGDPTTAPDGVRNLLWWMFTDDRPHAATWEATARQSLARFRAQHARRHGDAAFARLIADLQRASPRFRELWPRHEVLASGAGTKTIEHPVHGRLAIYHLQSIPTTDPELRLVQFVPGDAHTRAAFAELAAAPG